MSKVLVPIAKGFEEVEAVTIIDLLRRAGVEVTTAGVGMELVKGAHGIPVGTDTTIQKVQDETYDAVILPGGLPGTTNLAESPEVEKVLKKHHEGGQYVTAICAAPSVLAKYGILNGKNATCYPGFEENVPGAHMQKDRVVEDGKIITSQGPATAIPFALKLIEKLEGRAKSEEIRGQVLAQ